MSTSPRELWSVRPAGAAHHGNRVSFDVLRRAIEEESVGDLDEVRGPVENDWQAVGEHPLTQSFVPQPTRLKVREEEDTESDLTPMIDVTFQLLIFFMITATFVVQKTLDLPKQESNPDAPAGVTMEELEKSNVIVRVAADGRISVDDQATPVADLLDALRQSVRNKESAELVLDVEDNAVHDLVVKVIDAAGAANIEKVHFVSRVGPVMP